ncbi:MAG: YraN family protein [Prolixibacteraceae bacterium]
MALHTDTGIKGEQLALQYLQEIGYQILDTNWHASHYEIDIVARDGNELVIVEVKTRRGETYGHPSEAVNNKKIHRLINAAERYIHRYKIDRDTRFDIVSVIFAGGKFTIEHIKDAFYPTAK